MQKVCWWIKGWSWNGYEYEPINAGEYDDCNSAMTEFENKMLHLDLPAVELYRSTMESEDGINWTMTDMEFIDRRDY